MFHACIWIDAFENMLLEPVFTDLCVRYLLSLDLNRPVAFTPNTDSISSDLIIPAARVKYPKALVSLRSSHGMRSSLAVASCLRMRPQMTCLGSLNAF